LLKVEEIFVIYPKNAEKALKQTQEKAYLTDYFDRLQHFGLGGRSEISSGRGGVGGFRMLLTSGEVEDRTSASNSVSLPSPNLNYQVLEHVIFV
jgi:hypothetical protein